MSIEQQWVQQFQVPMVNTMMEQYLQQANSGNHRCISPTPVRFEPVWEPQDAGGVAPIPPMLRAVPQEPLPEKDLFRVQIWMSPTESSDWTRAERVLKQWRTETPIGFEIYGNKAGIRLGLLIARKDYAAVEAAFLGEYGSSKLCPMKEDPLATRPLAEWGSALFFDYDAPSLVSHNLTSPEELKRSCFDSFLRVLAGLDESMLGVYQGLFQVAQSPRWHGQVEQLVNAEYRCKQQPAFASPSRSEQVPSDELHGTASQLDKKANDFRPFFFACARVLLLGAGADPSQLTAMQSFMGLFLQHGHPLERLGQDRYSCLGPAAIRQMFVQGVTFRCGFLANSRELANLVHFPILTAEECRRVPLEMLDPRAPTPDALSSGCQIGIYDDGGIARPICLSEELLRHHVLEVGNPGKGKSTMLKYIILYCIRHGIGIAVLDPHGDLVNDVLDLLCASDADRIVYFRPADPEYITLWNPVCPIPGQKPGRMASDIVSAFFSTMQDTGDRMGHLFRHAVVGMLARPGSTLRDVNTVLQLKTPESNRLRNEILQYIDPVENEPTCRFWDSEYATYTPTERRPIQHKLSRIIVDERMTLMFSQPHSAFSVTSIMKQQQVLLADLSDLGLDLRSSLGSLLLAQFRLNALSRKESERDLYVVVADEAHIMLGDNVEGILEETRKHGLGLVLAAQRLSQFTRDAQQALSGIRTSVIFNVNENDARDLALGLRGQVRPEELMNLKVGEAILRTDTEIVKIHTLPPPVPTSASARDHIIAESRRRYCQPREELARLISEQRGTRPLVACTAPATDEELDYEEFD